MGHSIIALIGPRSALAGLIGRFGHPEPVELGFDLLIMPLGEARLDMLAQFKGPPYDGFIYLGPELESEIARAVGTGPALYVETDYSGGSGSQGAAFFEAGEARWKDAASAGAEGRRTPISRGLASLGVSPSADEDEFDALGLGRFRSMRALGLVEED